MKIKYAKLLGKISQYSLELREYKNAIRNPHKNQDGSFSKLNVYENKYSAPYCQSEIALLKKRVTVLFALLAKDRGVVHFANQDVSLQEEYLKVHDSVVHEFLEE